MGRRTGDGFHSELDWSNGKCAAGQGEHSLTRVLSGSLQLLGGEWTEGKRGQKEGDGPGDCVWKS